MNNFALVRGIRCEKEGIPWQMENLTNPPYQPNTKLEITHKKLRGLLNSCFGDIGCLRAFRSLYQVKFHRLSLF